MWGTQRSTTGTRLTVVANKAVARRTPNLVVSGRPTFQLCMEGLVGKRQLSEMPHWRDESDMTCGAALVDTHVRRS